MEFLESLGNQVIVEMERDLTRVYTIEEVAEALKHMHPSNAPNP